MRMGVKSVMMAVVVAGSVGGAAAQNSASTCKAMHADLIEDRSTTSCRPGHTACFLGVVDGNQGLRGTTYFRGDSSTAPIPTSPEFRGYGGVFEYATEHGTLTARESGVTSATQGVVTAISGSSTLLESSAERPATCSSAGSLTASTS